MTCAMLQIKKIPRNGTHLTHWIIKLGVVVTLSSMGIAGLANETERSTAATTNIKGENLPQAAIDEIGIYSSQLYATDPNRINLVAQYIPSLTTLELLDKEIASARNIREYGTVEQLLRRKAAILRAGGTQNNEILKSTLSDLLESLLLQNKKENAQTVEAQLRDLKAQNEITTTRVQGTNSSNSSPELASSGRGQHISQSIPASTKSGSAVKALNADSPAQRLTSLAEEADAHGDTKAAMQYRALAASVKSSESLRAISGGAKGNTSISDPNGNKRDSTSPESQLVTPVEQEQRISSKDEISAVRETKRLDFQERAAAIGRKISGGFLNSVIKQAKSKSESRDIVESTDPAKLISGLSDAISSGAVTIETGSSANAFGLNAGERTMAEERARTAIQQAASKKYVEAEVGLKRACPALRSRLLLDLDLKKYVAQAGTKQIFENECYFELALVRAQRDMHRSERIDPVAFEAAQYATQTEAGTSLSRAAARSFARVNGGGPIVDEIDRNLAPLNERIDNFMSRWPSARRAGVTAKPEGTKPASTEEGISLISDLGELGKSTQANTSELKRLLAELRLKVPAYFEMRIPDAVRLEELQATDGQESNLLSPEEALVVWMISPGKKNGIVFAVSKKMSGWARITLNGDQIAKSVDKLRAQIDPCAFGSVSVSCNDVTLAFDVHSAWELHQALLGQPEIQRVIADTAIKTLMIVPSGSLVKLPPAVLITKEPSSDISDDQSPETWARSAWLFRSKAIAVLPSVSSLRVLRQTNIIPRPPRLAMKGQDRLFMLADPDFSGNNRQSEPCQYGQRSSQSLQSHRRLNDVAARRALAATLPRLPCTRTEAEGLTGILGGYVLYGRDAREGEIRLERNRIRLAAAEVVAFATHGIVAGQMGATEPALALAAPLTSEVGDDGLLTTTKVAGMKLSADLVLLSACDTASPDAEGMDGLSGLSRAFFFAGAKSVLASHWRVDEAKTAKLVIKAIELRAKGTTKAESLRQASEFVISGWKDDDDSAAHPRSWAPFTLIGDAQ